MATRDISSIKGETDGKDLGFIEAINGSHLHWSDFRDVVLQPFRIRCTSTADISRLPTTFLARLQTFQESLSKYDQQRQAWLLDVTAGRGLNATRIFPPNLVPPMNGTSNIRCMFPKMSREGLPLRAPNVKHSLYELPAAKPIFVCGFSMALFEKNEQAQLSGALSASGTVIDFSKAEVLQNQQLACPYLAFERVDSNSERIIETARNACAVTGAQCLRGQQQLFHKAYGLQSASQPPITFTCALSNENAVMNYHHVDDDGNYTMAALCKFDLENETHFNTFQAWIDAIESWATVYLLPRVKSAIGEVMLANPSPPPSPAPTSTSHLSIDTNSDNAPSIFSTLRQLWPMIPWHNDSVGETPINSSIAQCGTPLPTRQIRGQMLPKPPDSSTSLSSPDVLNHARAYSSMSQRMSLTPLHTDLPMSARLPRQSLHSRRFSSVSARSRSCAGSAPNSPCRPASLSPCTPGPEAPVSSKSPMLVLQRRLELAMSEIQDLRGQVDDLNGQMMGRTELVERRLEVMMERQDEIQRFMDAGGGDTGYTGQKKSRSGWVRQLEALVEEDLRTPIVASPTWEDDEVCMDCGSPISPSTLALGIPGHFSPISAEEEILLWSQPWLTEELLVWCLAVVMKDEKANLGALMMGALMMCCSGVVDSGSCVNIALIFAMDTYVKRALWHICARVEIVYEAAQLYELNQPCEVADQRIVEEIVEDVPIVLESA